MCFSATASFVTGTALLVIGVATLKKVQDPRHYLFAAMPLIFSLQQYCEGFVWLSLMYPRYEMLHMPATYIFLVISQIHWPVWVPLSIMLVEKNELRKKILGWMSVVGVGGSLILIYNFFIYSVNSQISSHHILYEINFPISTTYYGRIIYVILTVTPPFISSIKKMHWLAWATLVSYIAAKIFYNEFTVSVWCFFAAIISVVVYMVISDIAADNFKEKSTLKVGQL